MIIQLKRQSYVLVTLWIRDVGSHYETRLALTGGRIMGELDADFKKQFDKEKAVKQYLKSDDALKLIKEGWTYNATIHHIVPMLTQYFTKNT